MNTTTPTPAAPQHLPGQPVTGVVIRDGLVTLLAERHIRPTDLRLCVMPAQASTTEHQLTQEPSK